MTATIIERIKLTTAWAISDGFGISTKELRAILNDVRGETMDEKTKH
jgi:hypothetical protein